jgi:hypothetical protein
MSAMFSMVEALESRQLFTVTFGGTLMTDVPPPTTGLLLPAVQKVREAAATTQSGNTFMVTFGGSLSDVPPPTDGLLLPAVQKVREAAARMSTQPANPPPTGTVTFFVDGGM